jgi:hypothetical protein
MARFVVGDVVIVPFPFSDLTQIKRRPALVVDGLGDLGFETHELDVDSGSCVVFTYNEVNSSDSMYIDGRHDN